MEHRQRSEQHDCAQNSLDHLLPALADFALGQNLGIGSWELGGGGLGVVDLGFGHECRSSGLGTQTQVVLFQSFWRKAPVRLRTWSGYLRPSAADWPRY